MEAELSKDRVVKIEGDPTSDIIWFSFSGSITVGGMFTKKDMLLIHGMIGSVLK
jgi:hypothetical protein